MLHDEAGIPWPSAEIGWMIGWRAASSIHHAASAESDDQLSRAVPSTGWAS